MRDFPYESYPMGWFQVGWSEELAASGVQPIAAFGEEYVSYRDESGDLHILDAHCPHLGAHLGHGGKVAGAEIVCPFHGWKWDCDGRNTEIPYSSRANSARRLNVHPVLEQDGIIYMWRGPKEPSWHPPKVPEATDSEFYPVWPQRVEVREVGFPPQAVIENVADTAHTEFVHGWSEPNMEEFGADEITFRARVSGKVDTPRGRVSILADDEVWGIGLLFIRLFGIRDTAQLVSVTPIDGNRSIMRMTSWIRRSDQDESDRIADSLHAAQVRELFDRDAAIWENQRYVERAPLVSEESKPYATLRKWAQKFYELETPTS